MQEPQSTKPSAQPKEAQETPEQERQQLTTRTKSNCLLVVFNKDIPESLRETLRKTSKGMTIADLTTQLCSGEIACDSQEIKSCVPSGVQERHLEPGDFPCSEAREVYVLLLLQLHNKLNEAGNGEQEVEQLYAACCAAEKGAAGEHALYGDPHYFVTLLRRFRQMRGENIENAAFVSVLHRCSVIGCPALNAFQKFAEDFLDLVDAVPPPMRKNCLDHIAIKRGSQDVVFSFDANKVVALRDAEFNAKSIAIQAVLERKGESVQPVVIVALVLLQRLFPDPIFDKQKNEAYRIKESVQGDAVTGGLVAQLVGATNGGVSVENFRVMLASSCKKIHERSMCDILRVLFPDREITDSKPPEPSQPYTNARHTSFGEAAIDGCYMCALKLLKEKSAALTCETLKRLSGKHRKRLTFQLTQLLRAMDITDQGACQGQNTPEAPTSAKREEEKAKDPPAPPSDLCPSAKENQSGQKDPQPAAPGPKNAENDPARAGKACRSKKPKKETQEFIPSLGVGEMGTAGGQPSAAPTKKADDDPAAQQLRRIKEVEDELTKLRNDAPLPEDPDWLNKCKPKEPTDLVRSLQNVLRHFLFLTNPAKDGISPYRITYEDLVATLDVLVIAVVELGIRDDDMLEAAEALSVAAFRAILTLQDEYVWQKLFAQKNVAPAQQDLSHVQEQTAGRPQQIKGLNREKAVECTQTLLNLVWKMFFKLGCVVKSKPFDQLCAKMIQKGFGPSTRLHFNIELLETFRTVDLWIAAWRRNMDPNNAITGSEGEKEFSFVVPISTDGMLAFALRKTLGVQKQSKSEDLEKLLKQLAAIKDCEQYANLREKVQRIFTGICIKYAISQGWLSKEEEELCKPHLTKLLKDADDVDLAELGCIDLRAPKIPLQDSTPNWDYMELTVKYVGGKFTISFADIRQFKAPNRDNNPNDDTWRCLQDAELAGYFYDSNVYTKLKQTFQDYSVVFDEKTCMAAYAEYAGGAQFDFDWKDFLNPLSPAVECPVHCRNMYELEPMSESNMDAELERAYFLRPEKLEKHIRHYDIDAFKLQFQKQLVGFSGQVMVPIAKATPDTLEIKSDGVSFRLKGWPTKMIAGQYRQMLEHFLTNRRQLVVNGWNDAADMFLAAQFFQHADLKSVNQLRQWPLKEIIRVFVNAFTLSDSSSLLDFEFNDTKTSFQAVVVRVWGPILIRSKESKLYELFRVGEKGGLEVGSKLYDKLLKVLENAGDKNFEGMAFEVIKDAEKRVLRDASNAFTAKLDQAKRSACICNGASVSLGAAAMIGCQKCAAEHISEAGTLVDDKTAMMIAAIQDNKEVVELLAVKEAGLRFPDGKTALMHAAEARSPGAVEALIPHEAGLQDAEGKTALVHAIQSGCADVARMLLPHEEKIVDEHGLRPADHAMAASYPRVWKLFPNDIGPGLAAQLARAHTARCTCQERSENLMHAAYLGCSRCAVRFIARAGEYADDLTALMLAAAKGHLAVAQLLVHREGKLMDRTGRTALMLSAMNGHLEVAQLLIPHEAKMQDQYGQTALIYAIASNQVKVAELLLPFEVDLKDSSENTPAQHAKYASPEMQALFAKQGQDLEQPGPPQPTCECGGETKNLVEAAGKGCVECVNKYFGEAGKLVGRVTALTKAVIHGHIEIVKLLIPREVKMRNSPGDTALMEAARIGNLEAVELLISHEAKMQDMYGETALMEAARNGQLKVIKPLIPHEAGMRNSLRQTALMISAENGHLEIAQLLIPHEAKMQDQYGKTALIYAIEGDYLDVAKLLLPLEGDIANYEGITPAEYAKDKSPEMQALFAGSQ